MDQHGGSEHAVRVLRSPAVCRLTVGLAAVAAVLLGYGLESLISGPASMGVPDLPTTETATLSASIVLMWLVSYCDFGVTRSLRQAAVFKRAVHALRLGLRLRQGQSERLRRVLALFALAACEALRPARAQAVRWRIPPEPPAKHETTAAIRRTGPPARTWAYPQVLTAAA